MWLVESTFSVIMYLLNLKTKTEIKTADKASTSDYKKPQCKKVLTIDQVLAALLESENDSDGLKEAILQPRSIPERSSLCVDIKRTKTTGKKTNKSTLNYCEKCQKYICGDCFKAFHTQSQL